MPTHKDIIGSPWNETLKAISEGTIDVNDTLPFPMYLRKPSTQSQVLSHLRQWGMDIVGPLPTRATQKKFLLIATNYFSKWVEAKAYASIKDKDVSKFIWKTIVCRFEIPSAIVRSNGPQFDSVFFRTFCLELNIKNLYSTPRYPQSNR